MKIIPFQKEHLPEAARLFVENYKQQRLVTCAAPAIMEDEGRVSSMLEKLMTHFPTAAAIEDGRLVGYLGAYLVDHFRETKRKGAYCPEWAHGAVNGKKPEVYRSLYRHLAGQWAAAGCGVHAITLLANDKEAFGIWCWNGFGMVVVDGVRPLQPFRSISPAGAPSPKGITIRMANLADAAALADLDVEHWQHYARPPVFMVPQIPDDEQKWKDFLSDSQNSVWLALVNNQAAGFLRFNGSNYQATEVLNAENSFCITGAYVRLEVRGLGVASALLEAALRDYSTRGFERGVVDFESFNPEAASFWPRFFDPVCFSLMRIPESETAFSANNLD